MNRSSKFFALLVVWIGTSTGPAGMARAQFGVPQPAIPATPVPAAFAAPVAAPAAPRTLWSNLGLSSASLHACRDKLCALPLGQMMNGMLMPVGSLTGGMIPTICPPISNAGGLADQAAKTGGPAGPARPAAAAIQADVAGAGARIAAIEYLATVDCHYWPEAEALAIGRLRGDRVECVRFAAARALGSGCCCTKKTIEALQLVVAGEDKDGFPSETSERVRVAAEESLQNCITRSVGKEPAQEPREQPEPATPQPPDTPRHTEFVRTQDDSTTQDSTGILRGHFVASPRPCGSRCQAHPVASSVTGIGPEKSHDWSSQSLRGPCSSDCTELPDRSSTSGSEPRTRGGGGPQPSPPVLNLAHDGEPGPQQSPGPQQTSLAGMPPERAQAELGRPGDVSVNQTSHGESSKDPMPRSVFQLIRRSLHPRR